MTFNVQQINTIFNLFVNSFAWDSNWNVIIDWIIIYDTDADILFVNGPHVISVSVRLLFFLFLLFQSASNIPPNSFELFKFYNSCLKGITVARREKKTYSTLHFNQLFLILNFEIMWNMSKIFWKRYKMILLENPNKIQHKWNTNNL